MPVIFYILYQKNIKKKLIIPKLLSYQSDYVPFITKSKKESSFDERTSTISDNIGIENGTVNKIRNSLKIAPSIFNSLALQFFVQTIHYFYTTDGLIRLGDLSSSSVVPSIPISLLGTIYFGATNYIEGNFKEHSIRFLAAQFDFISGFIFPSGLCYKIPLFQIKVFWLCGTDKV